MVSEGYKEGRSVVKEGQDAETVSRKNGLGGRSASRWRDRDVKRRQYG